MTLPDFLASPPFAIERTSKLPTLVSGLIELTEHHRAENGDYRIMTDILFDGAPRSRDLSDLPWLPVRLFKMMDLLSVPRNKIVKQLVSSGTSGQRVSRIYLDAETASLQGRAMARIATEFIGGRRLPMIVLDDKSFLDDRLRLNGRAAGIMGFSPFGRDHFYLLNKNLEPDWSGLDVWLAEHAGSPILLFGFTFIVWQYFIQHARASGVTIRFPPGSMLVHGGGWKRLSDRQVDNEAFKTALAETFSLSRVYNYYGMVEQVGSIFFECEAGYLHAPGFADLIVRDPITLKPSGMGNEGVIQILSLLPRSYPGHSLLTEDLGIVHGEDDCSCGRKGKRFSVSGRLKNIEIRGCSDTRAVPSA